MKILSPAQLDTLCVVHYGSKKFHPAHMSKITNLDFMNKPTGGLWTSPLNSSHSWRDWCSREEFRDYAHDNYFMLKFKPEAKVLVIDSIEDLISLPRVRNDSMYLNNSILDYPKLAKRFDAIWLTAEGERATRYSKSINLYGWDVETVFLFKPKNVYEV
jgi:hypothetical protein